MNANVKMKYTDQIKNIVNELQWFNSEIDWVKFSAHYRKMHGYELLLQILSWLKEDVKQTNKGTPLNRLGKSAYPYLKKILNNPFWVYVHQHEKKEHIKDLDELGEFVNIKDIVKDIVKETTPNWVIKARKRHKFLTWKKERNLDEDRELNKITFNLKKFGYSESQSD